MGRSKSERLGEILVDRGLLTEGGLQRALDEQARTRQQLGEILVARGWISTEELTDALAEQDVPLDGSDLTDSLGASPRRLPLGRLLIEKGLLTEPVLELALDEQQVNWRPLGQILVAMGAISPENLARTLTEQHGFDFSLGLRARISAADGEAASPPESPDPVEVYAVRVPGAEEPLHAASSLLDAADAAFELLDERHPQELEIVRSRGAETEIVWSYKQDEGERRDLTDRLGSNRPA